MTIDTITLVGIAGFAAAILVFCGSVFLLLTIVLGARLAYFVSASVTLGFLLIMGVVWSIGTVPLGPVGAFGRPDADAIPHWELVDEDTDKATLEFGQAAAYPDAPWRVPSEEDAQEQTIGGELINAAVEQLEIAIEDAGEPVYGYEDAEDAEVEEETVRLLEREGKTYGMALLTPVPIEAETEGAEATAQPENQGADVFIVMEFDPGNQFGKARVITAGTFLLLVAHLFGLSRSEKRAKDEHEEINGA